MTGDPTYYIVLVPKLTGNDSNIDALAQKFRTFRLSALTKSAAAFASTYEMEIQRGLDQSVERLLAPKAAHFIALRRADETAGPAQEDDVMKWLLNDEWVGMNVLLGPEDGDELSVPAANLDPFRRMTASDAPASPPETDGNKDLHYHMNGMFVDPVTRGSGAGKGLMDAVLHSAAAEGVRLGKPVRVTLAVYSHNDAAYRLYTKSGFRVVKRAPSVTRPPSEAIHMQYDVV